MTATARRQRRAGLVLIAAVAGMVPLRSQPPASDPLAFLAPWIEVTREERRRLDNGEAVARTLPGQDGQIAVFVATRLAAPPDALAAWTRVIAAFKRSQFVLAIGRFSEPPVLSDLDEMALDDRDLEEVRRCRPGACGLKLTAAEIEALSAVAAASGDGWREAVQRSFRQLVLNRVHAYRTGGLAALPPPADRDNARRTGDALASIMARSPYLDRVPVLVGWLRGYPHEGGDVESFFYWSKEFFGSGKPVIGVTHVGIARPSLAAGTATIVAGKQILATHYSQTSLGLTMALPGAAGRAVLPRLRQPFGTRRPQRDGRHAGTRHHGTAGVAPGAGHRQRPAGAARERPAAGRAWSFPPVGSGTDGIGFAPLTVAAAARRARRRATSSTGADSAPFTEDVAPIWCRWCQTPRLRLETGLQLVQHRGLAGVDLGARLVEREPGGAVDLGKRLPTAGAWRPFHLEGIADESGRIEVGLDGPHMDDLAAGLSPRCQRHEVAGDCRAELLGHLADGGRQRASPGAISPLGIDQAPGVLPRPQRPAGMYQEHLDPGRRPAKQQQTRARRRHGQPCPLPRSAARVEERPGLQLGEGPPDLLLRVHHHRSVPGDRLADRRARHEQEAHAVVAGAQRGSRRRQSNTVSERLATSVP